MGQRNPVHGGDSAGEPKFYIPAGSAHSLVLDRLERLWAALFDNRVDGPS